MVLKKVTQVEWVWAVGLLSEKEKSIKRKWLSTDRDGQETTIFFHPFLFISIKLSGSQIFRGWPHLKSLKIKPSSNYVEEGKTNKFTRNGQNPVYIERKIPENFSALKDAIDW